MYFRLMFLVFAECAIMSLSTGMGQEVWTHRLKDEFSRCYKISKGFYIRKDERWDLELGSPCRREETGLPLARGRVLAMPPSPLVLVGCCYVAVQFFFGRKSFPLTYVNRKILWTAKCKIPNGQSERNIYQRQNSSIVASVF